LSWVSIGAWDGHSATFRHGPVCRRIYPLITMRHQFFSTLRCHDFPQAMPDFLPCRLILRSGLPLAFCLIFCSCSWLGPATEPDEETKAACGHQCLKNGEVCSQFFAKKNREQRLTFEQAKQNYWICLRKYPGFESSPNNPCIAPSPPVEEFDSCGQQLDECLELCRTNLDELAQAAKKEETRPISPLPFEVAPIESEGQ